MLKILIPFVIFLTSQNAIAVDLGIKAQTFPIKEEPFVKLLKKKAAKIDVKAEQKKMQKIAKDRINNPKPVLNIKPAKQNRIFHYDPTYTLKEDAILPCGKVLYKAGTSVNPLDHMNLERRLIFIDARREEQIIWLKEILNSNAKNKIFASQNQSNPEQETSLSNIAIEDRVILIAGSPSKLIDELPDKHKGKIYFDQHGELSIKFGIKASPAIAMQAKRFLKIEEIALEE